MACKLVHLDASLAPQIRGGFHWLFGPETKGGQKDSHPEGG